MGLKGKKKERKEKTKIKLKAKKTILPKGQNITDTSFKVKKIVIREQLKAPNEAEPLTRRKLNVKELISRLQHHNTNVRQDGLDGLKELTTAYAPEVFSPHLSALIEGITALILDTETVIRRDALKLLRSILTQVTAEQIHPFFDILQSYLGCAMTHIHTVTQEDSLLLLDVMLETTPSLIAEHSHKILPNFLDMISKLRADSQPGRTLTVNLGSKLTSVKWRIKVLTRLHGMLSALVANRSPGSKGPGQSVVDRTVQPSHRWNDDTALTVPVYYGRMVQTCELPALFGGVAVGGGETSGADLRAYMGVLMPLLFETWLEVAPIMREGPKEDDILSEESAELLKCIVEIIQLSWEYLQSYEQESKLVALTTWFQTEYENDVRKYLMPGFPFTSAPTTRANGRGKRKRHQNYGDDGKPSEECSEQNLAICHVLCCIHERGEIALCRQIVKYVTKCVLTWSELEGRSMDQLIKVLRIILVTRSLQWTRRGIKVEVLLDAVLRSVVRINAHYQAVVFEMLSDLVLDPSLAHLLECSGFENWRKKLPNVLCEPEVSLKTVKVLTRLACQNNRPFLDSFEEKLPQILGNMSTLVVVGAENETEGRRSVANLLYWVSKTPDFATIRAEHSENWDKPLNDYVDQLLC